MVETVTEILQPPPITLNRQVNQSSSPRSPYLFRQSDFDLISDAPLPDVSPPPVQQEDEPTTTFLGNNPNFLHEQRALWKEAKERAAFIDDFHLFLGSPLLVVLLLQLTEENRNYWPEEFSSSIFSSGTTRIVDSRRSR